MEFCFYCSRFPTPGQAWGCTPGNSRLGAAAYAALAGEASARPRRGDCTPGNSRLWSWSPVGTVQDRPRRQPRRRLTPRLWERLARVRAGGLHPGQFAPVVLVPGGDRSGPTEGAAETAAYAALVGEASARPRRGVAPRAIRACGPGPRWGAFRTGRDGGLRRACGRGRRTSAPWVSGDARRLEFRLPFTETSQNWGKL